MTEEQIEQKAKEYTNKNDTIVMGFEENLDCTEQMQQAFIDGYHECQKEHEWHDLRKDPTDLPKEEREYIVMNANEGGDTSYWICYYWKEEKKFTGYGLGEANVIKWKEIE